MVNEHFQSISILLSVLALACEAEPTAPSTTGGVNANHQGQCPAGVVAVLSDFSSTQIALSALDGTTLSEAFISTASSEASGLAFALSGDVVVPSATPRSGRVVLLDRYGTNVITWVDPKSAAVLAQLPVGTGFESNPQDYLELDDTSAYVSRWGQNQDLGKEAFDGGGDVLVIDTSTPKIVGRIEMPAEANLPARPSGMTRLGGDVAVTLQRLSLDFTTSGDGVLVGIATDQSAIAWQMPLTGFKTCGTLAVAPSGKVAALACAGQLDANGDVLDLGESGIVIVDPVKRPPVELRRFAALDLGGEAVQNDLEFATDSLLLFKTQTKLGGATNNRALLLDLDSGTTTALVEAAPDADGTGKGIVYGSLFCAPSCSDVCLMADADRTVLERWQVSGGGLLPLDPMRVETQVGLPPRELGGF